MNSCRQILRLPRERRPRDAVQLTHRVGDRVVRVESRVRRHMLPAKHESGERVEGHCLHLAARGRERAATRLLHETA